MDNGDQGVATSNTETLCCDILRAIISCMWQSKRDGGRDVARAQFINKLFKYLINENKNSPTTLKMTIKYDESFINGDKFRGLREAADATSSTSAFGIFLKYKSDVINCLRFRMNSAKSSITHLSIRASILSNAARDQFSSINRRKYISSALCEFLLEVFGELHSSSSLKLQSIAENIDIDMDNGEEKMLPIAVCFRNLIEKYSSTLKRLSVVNHWPLFAGDYWKRYLFSVPCSLDRLTLKGLPHDFALGIGEQYGWSVSTRVLKIKNCKTCTFCTAFSTCLYQSEWLEALIWDSGAEVVHFSSGNRLSRQAFTYWIRQYLNGLTFPNVQLITLDGKIVLQRCFRRLKEDAA